MNDKIIFIDPRVENYQILLQGADRNAEIVILEGDRSAIEQITKFLPSTKSLKSLHLVSHGSDGTLFLGNSPLNQTTLETHEETVKQWGKALKPNAEIFLYGCNVAQTSQGKAFVKRLSELTKANVAASTTPTGNAELGGDWNLEFIAGEIKSALAFSPQSTVAYKGILGNGPGGVDIANGTSLQVWLDASTIVGTNGSSVTNWADGSGAGNNATGTGATLVTNAINGQSVVKFDGINMYSVGGSISNPYTVLSVSKLDGVQKHRLISSAIGANNWLLGYWEGEEDDFFANGAIKLPSGVPATGNAIIYTGSGTGSLSSFYKNGSLLAANSNGVGSPLQLSLGATSYGGPNWEPSDGKVAELIAFNRVLNDAERTLIDNYLSAKYNIALTTPDKYGGDNIGSDYDRNVAGIGREANGSNISGDTKGGLIIDNGTFLQDSGDYLIAGQIETTAATNVTTDLPSGATSRWSRVWYLDKTDINSNGGTVNLTFNFTVSGVGGTPSGNYRLLYRSGQTGAFSFVGNNGTISGNQVIVNGIDSNLLADGYYTLGSQVNTPPTLDTIANPTAINEDAAEQTINLTGISDLETAINALNIAATSNNTLLTGSPTITNNNNGTATLKYTPIANASGTATISVTVTDADNATVTQSFDVTVNPVNDTPNFTASNPTAVNEDAGATTVTAWATFNPGAANETGETASYVVSNLSNPSLFAAAPAIDAAGNLTYTPAPDAFGSSTFDVVVADSGGASSAPQTFTITVNPVSDTPSFTASNPAAVNEDAGATTVAGWATFNPGSANETGEIATYTVSNIANPGLFATAPAIDAAGNLTYTPASDAFGSSTFDVVVQDSGGATSALQSFTVTVNPINDAPSFTAIGNPPTVNEDVGAQTVAGWITNFNPGTTNEAGQIPTYVISNISNPALFAASPTVDATGSLTYTLAANANGNSSFDVAVQDSGGTPGVDTSPPQSFTLTVNPVNDAPSFSNLGNQTLPTWTNVPQTVAGWANTFNLGPIDEGGQAVNDFIITVLSGAELFAATPDIANDGTLTYSPNGTPGTATIQVQVQDNGGIANGGADTSAPTIFTITVPPPTVELSISSAAGSEAGTTTITVTATAAGSVVGNQTLDLVLSGTVSAADFSSTIPSKITIPDGTNTGQVTFTIANDLIDEDDETATVAISNPSAGITLGTSSSQTFTIQDDDVAGFDITPISGDTSEFASLATFDIRLKTQPTADVTISFFSNNAAEGTVSPATVTFTPTNWNTYQTVSITGVDDALTDGNISYTIVTNADTATSDTKYRNLDPNDVTVNNTDNDTPGVTIIQAGGNTLLAEGSTTDTYTIQLNTLPTGNVDVTAMADAQTEISLDGINFAPIQTLTYTSIDGMIPRTVIVRALDDANVEDIHAGSITHAITNSADATYPTTMAVGSVNPTITDNDINYSVIGSTTTVAESNAGTQQISFTIARSGAINAISTVDFALAGSATNGIDYNNIIGSDTGVSVTGSTISFAANSTLATLTLDVVGDRIDEDNETLDFTLLNATASGSATISGSPITTTITDDDTAGFTVNPTSGLATNELGSTATFEVKLNSQPTAPVTINLTSDNPAEGTPSLPSLTFDATNWNAAQTVTITGANDAIDDDNIAYNIITSAAISADTKYNSLDPVDVAVTNSDDDTAGITVTPISGNTTEAGGTATFTVVLNSQPTGDVILGISSDNPSEGTVSTPNLTFTAANWNVPQSVTVTGVDEAVDDGDRAYNIITAAATSTDSKYNNLASNDVALRNVDDDSIGVTISPISGNTTEAGGIANFTAVLNSQPTADVTINLVSSNAKEGTGPAAIIFTPANWNVAQSVAVTGVDDRVDDGDVAYTIATDISSEDTKYAAIAHASVAVTNTDDDTAGVTISPINTNLTEAGTLGSSAIALTSAPTAPVTINFSTNGQISSIAPITFDSNNWNVPQTVTFSAIDDIVAQGDRSVSITPIVASTDSHYNGIAIAPLTASITDDDTPGVSIIQPIGSTDVLEGFGQDIYKVLLKTPPTAEVTIAISTDGKTATDIQTLTFNSTNWNIPQTVTVTAVDDAVAESSHISTISHTVSSGDPAYAGIAPIAPIIVNISDNDNLGEVRNLSEKSILNLSDLDDKLNGSMDNDIIYARLGNDIVEGGAGDDILYGQLGDNGIAGGDGNDIIVGETGNEHFNGNAGEDFIYADKGSDRLRGGAGNDLLFGEDGNDYIAGDRGVDLLTGGTGNDAFAIGIGMGGLTLETADVITDFILNEDRIDLMGNLTFNQLKISQGTGVNVNDTLIQDAATNEYLAVVQGAIASSFNPGNFV